MTLNYGQIMVFPLRTVIDRHYRLVYKLLLYATGRGGQALRQGWPSCRTVDGKIDTSPTCEDDRPILAGEKFDLPGGW